jgi:hypothetical protein
MINLKQSKKVYLAILAFLLALALEERLIPHATPLEHNLTTKPEKNYWDDEMPLLSASNK